MSHSKVGKRAAYINKSLLRISSSDIPDPIRKILKRYYTTKEESIKYAQDLFPSPYFNSSVKENSLDVGLIASVPLERLYEFASAVNTTARFSDYYYRKVLPMDKDTLEKSNKVGTTDYIDVNSYYSFYAKIYESVLSKNPTLPENILPSFYALYAQGVYEQDNVKPLNNIDSNFKSDIAEGFFSSLAGNEKVKSRFMKYFNDYGTALSNMISSDSESATTLSNLSLNYSTYVFTESSIPLFTSEATKGEMFPMYNKVSFSTDTNTAFSNILRELKIEKELVREIVGTAEDELVPFGQSIEKYTPSDSGPPNPSDAFSDQKMKMWDVKEWITDKIFNSVPTGVEIGEKEKLVSAADESIQKLFTKMILSARINDLSKNRLRTLEEMMDGKPSYSEEVMYKIEKFDYLETKSPTVQRNPIATFYIPNSSKLDVCNFIDTQVKYGKRYKYVVYSYDLVIGSEYSYPDASSKDGKILKVTVKYDPSIKIIENKISELDEVVVVDHPPMAPGISFVPYREINNKVLINLNSSTGDRLLVPVTLDNSDVEKFELIKKSQRRIDDKIRFKSDDISAIFEVYRTTEKPKSYQDFAGKKYTVTGELSSAAAFRDDIEPNTDYYYSFRTRDVHGNVSNPSVVYKIKMEDLGDGPHFLDVDVVDFEEMDTAATGKEVVKAMRRYVQILPTVPQGLLNVKESDLLDVNTVDGVTSVVLGVADESLWNKKFKIRFTSKKTGRKVDLDVNFVVEHKLKQT